MLMRVLCFSLSVSESSPPCFYFCRLAGCLSVSPCLCLPSISPSSVPPLIPSKMSPKVPREPSGPVTFLSPASPAGLPRHGQAPDAEAPVCLPWGLQRRFRAPLAFLFPSCKSHTPRISPRQRKRGWQDNRQVPSPSRRSGGLGLRRLQRRARKGVSGRWAPEPSSASLPPGLARRPQAPFLPLPSSSLDLGQVISLRSTSVSSSEK